MNKLTSSFLKEAKLLLKKKDVFIISTEISNTFATQEQTMRQEADCSPSALLTMRSSNLISKSYQEVTSYSGLCKL